ncbi:metallophosphoesterase family protein [Desulfogranum mediterraneum]|uniref:metallophosphoesterase family protein n=1 Tax=Desulfogranum mediterraneum TaxID=160661 RepID=UPI0004088BB6|nr:metallophosphoesterase family protein [Desulfogranum mediterraneum]
MRIAILADIHGNYQALQAVLRDLDRQGVGEIISLGDNVGYGPQPEEVVRALMARGVRSVMGNHELALISAGYYKRLNPAPRESLDLSRGLLSAGSCSWLEDLPDFLLAHNSRFVHGCPPQSMTTYLFSPSAPRLERIFSSYPEQLCFCGHTHSLLCYRYQGQQFSQNRLKLGSFSLAPESRYIIIPGSVGQPRDALGPQAKYLLWDQASREVEIRGLDYDVETTIRLLKERGFPLSNARRLR